jgi:hypothetical protein
MSIRSDIRPGPDAEKQWNELLRTHEVNAEGCNLEVQLSTDKGWSGTLKFKDLVHASNFTDAAILAGFNISSTDLAAFF